MNNKKGDFDINLFVAGAVVLAIIMYVWWEEKGGKESITDMINSFYALNWTLVGMIFIGTITAVVSLYMSYKIYSLIALSIEQKKQRQEYLEETEEKLLQKLKTDFFGYNPSETEEKYNKIKWFINNLPEELSCKYKARINKFYKNTKILIRRKKIEEENEREMEERRINRLKNKKMEQELKEERKYDNKVNELLEFKKKKKSINVLPINKNYPEDIKEEAKRLARFYFEELEERKIKRKEAIEFYSQHDIDTKPDLDSEEDINIYEEIRNDIKEGKLDVKKKVNLEYQGKKLDFDLYRSKELSDEQKLRAKAQGFVQVDGIKLDGRIQGGGYYIRKENSRESSKHFYMKHLFAELHDNMEIEHQIGDKRADVVLSFENYKMAIEIETGVNRMENLIEKVKWLNEHFDQWIFVCPREFHTKYNKLVDHNKSFCLGPKKAKEFVEDIIASAEHL